ncbi:hypothetical protein QJS10_CPA09g00955 [Acorus calamus]|uniref:DUF4283 domain-containing protein n=1 Tax=Acorus calamus TaxID=4465 RepID=A0AAV9E2Q5_ACOCL|nr:hypothetical protein QJS10_CPA09g00955 [Acorus calamus]
MEQERLTSIPIWVKFPNLPLHFWTKECLGKIASSVGTPLFMDAATQMVTRITYARVCVEVSAKMVLPDVVVIEMAAGGRESFPIVYDWKPHACSHCHTFGHDDALCCKRPRLHHRAPKPQQQDGFTSREKGELSHLSGQNPRKPALKNLPELKSKQSINKFLPLVGSEEEMDDEGNTQQTGTIQDDVEGHAPPNGQKSGTGAIFPQKVVITESSIDYGEPILAQPRSQVVEETVVLAPPLSLEDPINP